MQSIDPTACPSAELQNLAALLAQQPDIQLAILFGSLARGTFRADSDVDIAVLAATPLTSARKSTLIETIAMCTGRPVDLVDLATVGEPLLGHILQGKRLVGSTTLQAKLLTRHLLDTADFVPLQNRILQERRQRWIRA